MTFQKFLRFFIFTRKAFLNNIIQSNQHHNLKAGNHYLLKFGFIIIILQLFFLQCQYFSQTPEFHMEVFLSLHLEYFFLSIIPPNLCSSNLMFLINLLMKFKIPLIVPYIEFYHWVMPSI